MILTIAGKPQGKLRPRFSNGIAYTPRKTHDYEDLVKWAWKTQGKKEKIEGAVRVCVEAIFEPPRSYSTKKQFELLGRPYMHKPDIDNILKICCDGLNGLAFDDDNQVVSIMGVKKYGRQNAVVIHVEPI